MITFSHVSLIYPNSTKTVLEDLSFEVREGEFVLVIGSTGIGKSSLLKLMNGLVPHHTGGILAGEVRVGGISTREVTPGGLAHIVGIVGQNPLAGFVTDIVEEELAFGMESLNIPPETMRKRIEEVLDLLSLSHLRNRSIATLSGGEQQRVAIGSALVMNPKLLVLDEPTSALDPIAAEEVLSILHRLVHDLGLTVIISEHRLERVIHFVDRILEIHEDGMTKIGTPQEIMLESEIAPPIIHLARALSLPKISLSVRDMRRATEQFRSELPTNIGKPQIHAFEKKSLVIAESVSFSYSKVEVLRDMSFEIGTGEVVALMGRNGSGKSTLLKSIAGLHKTMRGKIRVLDKNPSEFNGRKRTNTIGYIPQEPSDLLFNQSVSEECRQADKDNGVSEGVTIALLSTLAPGIAVDAHPRDLSEGQRLTLAMSVILSAQPKLLILDEPTRGLDYEAKSSLVSILNSLSQKGTAIILATHDVELVAEVSTRVIFIADGEVIADGTTLDVLLSSPAFAPQVAKVMSPAPWLTVKDVIWALKE